MTIRNARLRATTFALGVFVVASCGSSESPEPPSPEVLLIASPTSVPAGGSATLVWTVANATECEATGGWFGPKAAAGGSEAISVPTGTEYVLTCTGENGATAEDSTFVSIQQARWNEAVWNEATWL